MSGPFIGKYEVAVHNCRIIIPAVFKKKFSDESNRTVVITVGPNGSIGIFPMDSWNESLEMLEAGDDSQRRLRSRLLSLAVMETELEGPGRIRVPEKQLRKAGITDSVVVKGEHNFISLWNPTAFEKKYEHDLEECLELYDSFDFHNLRPSNRQKQES
jgi:division/cell wall cluster transcriptional repressor MraZ